MKVRSGWALAALLLLPWTAWAVGLRYSFTVGEAQSFTETMSGSGNLTMDTVLGPQVIPLQIEASEQRTLKATETAGTDGWWVESRSQSASGTVTMAGQKMSQNLAGVNLRMRLNSRGDVLEVKTLETPTDDGQLDLKLDTLLAAARLVSFPPGNVEVGATWHKELPLRTDDGVRLTAQVSSRLVSLKTVDSRAMAEIESRYDIPIPQTEGRFAMGAGTVAVQISGRTTGTSTTLWDIAAGRTARLEGTGKLDLKLSIEGTPASASFDLKYGIRPQA